MIVLRQAEFVDRLNFPRFLNERGLVGAAVEVGTHRADFADPFLCQWHGGLLWCVDTWEENAHVHDSEGREGDYMVAERRLHKHGQRVKLMRMRSRDAVGHLPNRSLDFAYLDGRHERHLAAEDIGLWWPKLKPGGVLAGHDFLHHGPDARSSDGVQQAAFEHAERYGLQIFLVAELKEQPWSFYVVKP